MIDYQLNMRALDLAERAIACAEELRVRYLQAPSGGRILDFGIETTGSMMAGILLAEICMADLADVSLSHGELGGLSMPYISVTTDHPIQACLFSQYAGMQIAVDQYFAMGSGPLRAIAPREELFKKYHFNESSTECLGVLETSQIPTDEVFQLIANQTGIPAENTLLLVAPTSSLCGNAQIVARSVETAMHKLYELNFDLSRIMSASGIAPLPPVAADDMAGIGRTNDAILYGSRVTLWVSGDDASLSEIGHQVPSSSSPVAGKPFLEIFEAADRDFYQIDPHLFSPAEIIFQNIETGHLHSFGEISPALLRDSFGMV